MPSTLLRALALTLLFALALAPAATTADGEALSATALQEWTELHLSIISATFGFLSPPGTARSLAMVTTAMWDAAAPFLGGSVSAVMSSNGLSPRPEAERTQANLDLAVSSAAHAVLHDVFGERAPELLAEADELLERYGGDPADDSPPSAATASGVGRIAAVAVLEFRHRDGMNQLGDEPCTVGGEVPYNDYTMYSAANDPQPALGRTDCGLLRNINKWQPLRVPRNATDTTEGTVRSWLAPYMSNVVPFALPHGGSLRPGSPPVFGTDTDAEFRRQHNEVLDYSARLDDYGKVVAEFWADGPKSSLPPGHWHDITLELTRSRGLSFEDTLRVLFLQANAVFDAGIAAWDTKRFYDSSRPVTVLQCLHAGKDVTAWKGPYQGVGEIDGSAWQPYQDVTFVTPPFAEYVSGHSTFSTASAEVLSRFFDSDVYEASHTVRAGESLFEPRINDTSNPRYQAGVTDVPNAGPFTAGYVPAADVTLRWSTFSEAADEAGLSRIYGGIHIEAGDIEGRKLGREVGKLVWARYLELIGDATDGGSSSEDGSSSQFAVTNSDVREQAFYGSLAASAVLLGAALLVYVCFLGAARSRAAKEHSGGGKPAPIPSTPSSAELGRTSSAVTLAAH